MVLVKCQGLDLGPDQEPGPYQGPGPEVLNIFRTEVVVLVGRGIKAKGASQDQEADLGPDLGPDLGQGLDQDPDHKKERYT